MAATDKPATGSPLAFAQLHAAPAPLRLRSALLMNCVVPNPGSGGPSALQQSRELTPRARPIENDGQNKGQKESHQKETVVRIGNRTLISSSTARVVS